MAVSTPLMRTNSSGLRTYPPTICTFITPSRSRNRVFFIFLLFFAPTQRLSPYGVIGLSSVFFFVPHTALLRRLCGVTELFSVFSFYFPHTALLRRLCGVTELFSFFSFYFPHTALLRRLCGVTELYRALVPSGLLKEYILIVNYEFSSSPFRFVLNFRSRWAKRFRLWRESTKSRITATAIITITHLVYLKNFTRMEKTK